MPVVPPAPATFSTTNCWPSALEKYSPVMRAITSVGPPAANGTMMVTGRVGYCWSAAKADDAAISAAANTSNVFLIFPP